MGMQKFGHSLMRMLQSQAFYSRQVPAVQVPAAPVLAKPPDVFSYGMITLIMGVPVFYYILYWTDHEGKRTQSNAIKAAEKELKRGGHGYNSKFQTDRNNNIVLE